MGEKGAKTLNQLVRNLLTKNNMQGHLIISFISSRGTKVSDMLNCLNNIVINVQVQNFDLFLFCGGSIMTI